MQRGLAAAKARNSAEAARWFETAWRENPDNHQARAWLGQALCSVGRRVEGVAHLLEAGRAFLVKARQDKNLNYILEVAGQLQHWSEHLSALELLQGAVEVKPEDFRGQQLLAATYAQLNKKTQAIEVGERALALAPANQMMRVFLASLEADAGRHASARERLETVIAAQPNPREAFRAHKELARVLDATGDFEQVFPHLHAAGAIATSLPEYARQDARLIPEMVKTNLAQFDRRLMERWAGTAFSSPRPAPSFVMGFMRSGTTLTQEVLDAHPDVFVADEVELVPALKRELHGIEKRGTSTAEKLALLDQAGVEHLRDFYWQKVYDRFGETIGDRVFVDKLTMNTVDVGLINCVFPDSKVIFVMRDPRDVCVSCFMQLMVPTPTTVQMLTWAGTSRFYALVMAWWSHVSKQLTLPFLELRYENVVANFEASYRNVFDFLGLPWDASVVDFHKRAAEKFVATPSRTQVTKPLYASSVGRWRSYESDMATISVSLDPFIDEFKYRQ